MWDLGHSCLTSVLVKNFENVNFFIAFIFYIRMKNYDILIRGAWTWKMPYFVYFQKPSGSSEFTILIAERLSLFSFFFFLCFVYVTVRELERYYIYEVKNSQNISFEDRLLINVSEFWQPCKSHCTNSEKQQPAVRG